MKKIVIITLFTALDLWLCLGGMPSVNAQEDDEEYTLEEITVTAQKREQALQKVASPVEVIQGYELTEMGDITLIDALKNISSALVNPVGEDMNVTIRGMDNDEMPGDSFSQVAVTVDGSFSNAGGVGQGGLYDMQRVEVLVGPQGTLYSRNSSGGVVNMISNEPDTEDFKATGAIELGNYTLANAQGTINVPLNDKMAFRAAFQNTKRDGYINNGTGDKDLGSARLKLKWSPNEDLSAVITYEFMQLGGRGEGFGVDAFEYEDDIDNPWVTSSQGWRFQNWTETKRFYMNLTWDTPIGQLTFLPSIAKTPRKNLNQEGVYQSLGPPGPGAPRGPLITLTFIHFDDVQKEKSAELRMTSHEESFIQWVAGLYYYNRSWLNNMWVEDVWYEGTLYEGFKASGSEQSNPSQAAFGNFTIPVTDSLRLVAGGRYTKDKEKLVSNVNEPEVYKSDHFDYKLAIEYDLGENSMLWVDHSTGYKHVMRNAASQTLKSYQAGIKNRFLNNKFQLNSSAFYYDYSNFSINLGTREVPSEGGMPLQYMGRGIGDAELYGIDVSTDYVLSGNDRMNIGVSYLNATVAEVVATYSLRTDPTVTLPKETIMGGKPLNNAPKLSITGSYQHRFDLAGGGSITPRIDAIYKSKYYCQFIIDASNIPEDLDPDKVNTSWAHYTTDISMNYSDSSDKWTLNGYVKNITNFAEKTGFMRGDLRISAPRTFGAVLSLNF